ncbi:hypothetical protein HanHA89_Chr16g0679531 [Helianthus annuus]|nr:hypothetical protein HanHA89_Chr16g0679531 [Helianthus annuus]
MVAKVYIIIFYNTSLSTHMERLSLKGKALSNPSNYTYIPLKNNSYINIFPLKTNTFSLLSIK